MEKQPCISDGQGRDNGHRNRRTKEKCRQSGQCSDSCSYGTERHHIAVRKQECFQISDRILKECISIRFFSGYFGLIKEREIRLNQLFGRPTKIICEECQSACEQDRSNNR